MLVSKVEFIQNPLDCGQFKNLATLKEDIAVVLQDISLTIFNLIHRVHIVLYSTRVPTERVDLRHVFKRFFVDFIVMGGVSDVHQRHFELFKFLVLQQLVHTPYIYIHIQITNAHALCDVDIYLYIQYIICILISWIFYNINP